MQMCAAGQCFLVKEPLTPGLGFTLYDNISDGMFLWSYWYHSINVTVYQSDK